MKSLNRTLSLVLVLAMCLGLMGIASAASFTDDGTIQYKEAVSVMTGIGAINGYTDGSIKPTGTITREEAAKLIAYSVLGKDVAEKLSVGATGFTDVASNRWSAPYISYLVGQKIISGMGDGTFAPTANVTGYQVAKMMLVAAGYGAKGEFTGASWELAVAVAANKAKLFSGAATGVDYSKPATRQEAMLYTFNGIVNTPTVTYNKLFDQYTNVTATVSGKTVNVAIKDTVYPKLTMKDATVDGVKGYIWALNGKNISSFVSDVSILATSKDGTAIADLINNLKSSYIGYEADSTVVYKYNGAIDKTNAEANATNRGAIVNFYDEDSNGKYNTISVTYDAVDTVTGAVVTKTTGAVTTVTVPGLPITGIDVTYVTGYEGLVKDDVVTYHQYSVAGATYFAITKATVVTGTLNAFNTLGEVLVIDGKQYKTSKLASADAIGDYAKYATVAGTTFYLDAAGYVITASASQTVNTLENTVYVLAAEKTTFTAQAQILKADGKTEIVTVAKTAKYNGALTPVMGTLITSNAAGTGTVVDDGELVKDNFYTFVKNTDGTYNLTVAQTNTVTGVSITKGAPALGTSGAIATNGTVFVYYNTDKGAAQVFTGIANAPTHADKNVTAIVPVYACIKDSNGLATFVVAVGLKEDYSTATSANTKYVFPYSTATTIKVDANTTYYQYNAVVDGVLGTFSTTTSQNLIPGVLYAFDQFDGDKGSGTNTTIADTLVAKVDVAGNDEKLTNIKDFVVAGTTVLALGTAGTPASATGSYVVSDTVKVYRYNGAAAKTPCEEISLAELNNMVGDTYAIQATEKSLTDGTLTAIFVEVTAAGAPVGPVLTPGVFTSVAGTVYSVDYYAQTSWTVSKAVDAVKADLVANGWTVADTTLSGGIYTFDVVKVISGAPFSKTYTLPVANVKEVFKTGTAKLVVTGTGYTASSFTVTADKEYAPDNGVVTYTVKFVGTTDANDTATITPSNANADTAIAGSITAGNMTTNGTFTCSMAVNAKDMGETTITIAVTVA
jgi:hypothetical protein